MDDAPSNRTFGNCLLGVHCSQKNRPGTRVIAGFPAVAAIRHVDIFHRFSTALTGTWIGKYRAQLETLE
jgi:hypothetical protein